MSVMTVAMRLTTEVRVGVTDASPTAAVAALYAALAPAYFKGHLILAFVVLEDDLP